MQNLAMIVNKSKFYFRVEKPHQVKKILKSKNNSNCADWFKYL